MVVVAFASSGWRVGGIIGSNCPAATTTMTKGYQVGGSCATEKHYQCSGRLCFCSWTTTVPSKNVFHQRAGWCWLVDVVLRIIMKFILISQTWNGFSVRSVLLLSTKAELPEAAVGLALGATALHCMPCWVVGRQSSPDHVVPERIVKF